MKIIVTGGSGLIGSRIVNLAKDSNKVLALFNRNPIVSKEFLSAKIDITNKEKISDLILDFKPDAVFHTAALTDVDYCEDHRDEAMKINIEGTRNVVEAADVVDSKVVFISTDYVFDGKNGPYLEDDEPNPINFHGYTKLEGEKIVLENYQNIVARTTVVFGRNPTGKIDFVTFIVNSLSNGKAVKIVTDQWGTPTLADFCAEILVKLVEKNKSGIYNVVGKSFLNRYDFAVKIANEFNLDSSLIQKTTSDEFKQKAPRPRKAGLKVDKIENELGMKVPTIEEFLKIIKKQGEGNN